LQDLSRLAGPEWSEFHAKEITVETVQETDELETYRTGLARCCFRVGSVLRFDVENACLERFESHRVGGDPVLGYWIPAEELG